MSVINRYMKSLAVQTTVELDPKSVRDFFTDGYGAGSKWAGSFIEATDESLTKAVDFMLKQDSEFPIFLLESLENAMWSTSTIPLVADDEKGDANHE